MAHYHFMQANVVYHAPFKSSGFFSIVPSNNKLGYTLRHLGRFRQLSSERFKIESSNLFNLLSYRFLPQSRISKSSGQ